VPISTREEVIDMDDRIMLFVDGEYVDVTDMSNLELYLLVNGVSCKSPLR
jgi:hypothetical protein